MAKQIDIIVHAYKYLGKLHDHIDPLSGSQMPEFSAVWEMDSLLRSSGACLEYIIDNDNPDLSAFCITPEQAKQVPDSLLLVTTAELLDRINCELRIGQCQTLKRDVLYDWLEDEGCIHRDGGRTRVPTDFGQSFGIQRSGNSLKFAQKAQRFVIDHLQDISQFAQTYPEYRYGMQISKKQYKSLEKNVRMMELLSQGQHPETGLPLDTQDPLTQERLRKCFAYVAGTLKRAMEVGRFTAKKSFDLPQELWRNFQIRQEPINVKQFVDGVSALLPDPSAVRNLQNKAVIEYLCLKELIMETEENGTCERRVTSRGKDFGLEEGECINKKGEAYTDVFFNTTAQQYLVDNLGEIISLASPQ